MIMHMGKKIICIKEIPSNMIEEAIFILKSNIVENQKPDFEEKSKEIVLNEAEEIVDEYIEKMQEEKQLEIQNKTIKMQELKKEIIYIAGLLIILGICLSIVM